MTFAPRLKQFFVLATALLLVVAAPAFAAPESYDVRGVRVDATGADAGAARAKALEDGQAKAFAQLASELKPGGHVTPPSAAQLDRMMLGFEVEDERASATRYVGRLAFQFKASLVRDYLGDVVERAQSDTPVVNMGMGNTPPLRAPVAAGAAKNLIVRFASLGEWLNLRRRIETMPSLSRKELLGLSSRDAVYAIATSLPADQLAASFAAQNMRLDTSGREWLVTLAKGAAQ